MAIWHLLALPICTIGRKARLDVNTLERANRMLKKSASGVLASLRGSMYRNVRLVSSLAAALLGKMRVSARQGWAGEKSGLLEHPARSSAVVINVRTIEFLPCHNSFSADS
jgi:hypothetical protein